MITNPLSRSGDLDVKFRIKEYLASDHEGTIEPPFKEGFK